MSRKKYIPNLHVTIDQVRSVAARLTASADQMEETQSVGLAIGELLWAIRVLVPAYGDLELHLGRHQGLNNAEHTMTLSDRPKKRAKRTK